MLVNDNEGAIRLFKKFFEKKGLEVLVASGTAEAISKAKDNSFDLLWTDKNLEDSHRGCEPLLNYMQEERPYVPVVICSAEDGEQAKKELYCQEYLEFWIEDAEHANKFFNNVERILRQYQLVA